MTDRPRYRFEAVFHSGKVLTFEGESPFEITSAYGFGSGVFEMIHHVSETPLNEAARLEQEKHSKPSSSGDNRE